MTAVGHGGERLWCVAKMSSAMGREPTESIGHDLSTEERKCGSRQRVHVRVPCLTDTVGDADVRRDRVLAFVMVGDTP